jgi:hypothetical protein
MGKQLALDSVKQRIVPNQQVDGQLRALLDQRAEKIDQTFGISIAGRAVFADQARPAVDVPADNKDTTLRLDERRPQCAEVSAGIDQQSGTIGRFSAPNISNGLQELWHKRMGAKVAGLN